MWIIESPLIFNGNGWYCPPKIAISELKLFFLQKNSSSIRDMDVVHVHFLGETGSAIFDLVAEVVVVVAAAVVIIAKTREPFRI